MIKSNLNLISRAVKSQVLTLMAYRGDFFISVFLVFIGELILPLITMLIYNSGGTYPGWSLYQVLLLQGVFLLAKGIVNVMFSGIIYNTLSRVRDGSFDLLLIKPRGTLFMAILTGLNLKSVGSLLSGFFVFLISLNRLNIDEFNKIGLFLLFFIFSIMVLFAFNIISAAVVFKWVGNSRVFELFDCVTNFGMYPKSIFSKATQNFISYIVPIAAIGFYPSVVLMDKGSEGIIYSSIVSVLFLLFSLRFWNLMLKNYTSAGG